MEDLQKRPFMDVLEHVLNVEHELSIPFLFRLSDMLPDEFELFCERWPQTVDLRRNSVARHLADITEENFEVDFSPVFALLLSDRSAEVRKAALDGLWDTTNVSVVRPIISLMETDGDHGVRQAAAASLAHFVLMGEWGQISRSVKDVVVAALLAQHLDRENLPAVRRTALESLGASDHPNVPALIAAAYNRADRDEQLSALFAMGSSADKRWLEIVLDEMESPYAEMRAYAARAAGEIGSGQALSPLSELLYDEDIDVRTASVVALGKLGGEMAKRLLTEVLEEEEDDDLVELIESALDEMDWSGSLLDVDDLDWDAPSWGI
jgi:HEAT repeat protein